MSVLSEHPRAVAAFGAAIAGVLALRWLRSHASPWDVELSPHLEHAVGVALEREHDSAMLHALSAKLGAAGHKKAQAAVADRAAQIAGTGPHEPVNIIVTPRGRVGWGV